MIQPKLVLATQLRNLKYLFLLTMAFMVFEISFFMVCNQSYFSTYTLVSDHISIPWTILPGVLFFITAQISLHIVFCLLVWFTAAFSSYLLKIQDQSQFNYAIFIWILGIITVLALNLSYFPNSRFAELALVMLINPYFAAKVTTICVTLSAMLLAGAFSGLLLWILDYSFNLMLLALLILAAGSWITLSHLPITKTPPIKHEQPNIILIGIDSLRPDFLGYNGADHTTPFLDTWLSKASVFSEAITPLARTFPSWSSILLGQYPKESGIRFNLAKINTSQITLALPAILQRQGYETIFATDETRFSNIDNSFGFQQVITPPVGLNDFLLGTMNDFPLANLVVNTEIGQWLFPNSYGNRAAFITYNPDSFLSLIKPALIRERNQPLFLAVHFCLPHQPYLYSDLPGKHLTPTERYQSSIARVDTQMHDLFKLLTKANLLDNAIVVVLSDHGEALELPGDRITNSETFLGKGKPPHFYPEAKADEAINQSAGHGTDVLGLTQYHSLLAIRLYGKEQQIGDASGVVSLSGLKSAILALSGQQQKSNIADWVTNKIKQLPPNPVYIESDFSPAAIRTVYPETREVLLEGIQLFEIDPNTTRVSIKKSMAEMIINSKQYATISGDWMLALYPNQQKQYTTILVNLKTGQWTDDLNSKFAINSPSQKLLLKLKQFFNI